MFAYVLQTKESQMANTTTSIGLAGAYNRIGSANNVRECFLAMQMYLLERAKNNLGEDPPEKWQKYAKQMQPSIDEQNPRNGHHLNDRISGSLHPSVAERAEVIESIARTAAGSCTDPVSHF